MSNSNVGRVIEVYDKTADDSTAVKLYEGQVMYIGQDVLRMGDEWLKIVVIIIEKADGCVMLEPCQYCKFPKLH